MGVAVCVCALEEWWGCCESNSPRRAGWSRPALAPALLTPHAHPPSLPLSSLARLPIPSARWSTPRPLARCAWASPTLWARPSRATPTAAFTSTRVSELGGQARAQAVPSCPAPRPRRPSPTRAPTPPEPPPRTRRRRDWRGLYQGLHLPDRCHHHDGPGAERGHHLQARTPRRDHRLAVQVGGRAWVCGRTSGWLEHPAPELPLPSTPALLPHPPLLPPPALCPTACPTWCAACSS